MKPAHHWFVATALLLTAVSTSAQLATDQVPRERTVARSEEIREDLAESRFHFGPVRLHPIFGLRDTGYDNNVFATSDDPVGDWRATVSAGANLILPLGRKMYATAIVNPEYTYYKKLTNRRLMGGAYGGSLLALFNRLSVEAGGEQQKTIAPVNSELETSAPGTLRNVFARTELDIFRRLSVFGAAEQQKQRYASTDINLAPIERDDTYARAGIRYRLRTYFDFAVATETGRSEFVSTPQSDNTTHATILSVHYDRPRFFLNLSGGLRSIDPRGPQSTLGSSSGTTGSYYAVYQLAAPLAIEAYGHRSIVFGLYVASPYFYESRNGIRFTLPVGQRIGVAAFSEFGSNSYPFAAAGSARRRDDVTTYGGAISYRVYRETIITVTAGETRYDSTFPEFNRSLFRVTTLLSLTGDSFR
jgi:hypothetical protein